MFAVIILENKVYLALATGVLLVHALFVVWVIAGAVFTRSRPALTWLHIASLLWGIFVEVFPGSCPLTSLENWLESRAGIQPYQGGFLLHYLDALVYPDISTTAPHHRRSRGLCIEPCYLCTAEVEQMANSKWQLANSALNHSELLAGASRRPLWLIANCKLLFAGCQAASS